LPSPKKKLKLLLLAPTLNQIRISPGEELGLVGIVLSRLGDWPCSWQDFFSALMSKNLWNPRFSKKLGYVKPTAFVLVPSENNRRAGEVGLVSFL